MSTVPSRNRLAQGYDSSLEPRVMLAADDEFGNVKQLEKTPNKKKTQSDQRSLKKQAVKPRMAARQLEMQQVQRPQQYSQNKEPLSKSPQQDYENALQVLKDLLESLK